MLNTIKSNLLRFFTFALGGSASPDTDTDADADEVLTEAEDPQVENPQLSPDQEKLRALILHARAVGAAVAQNKVVRYIDNDGAILWLSNLSPQEARDKVTVLDDLGFETIDIVDLSALPRKPSWEIEYEDPQCYSIDAAPREDSSNYNLGTVELRMELIAQGMSPLAVVRATSASFVSPTFWIH